MRKIQKNNGMEIINIETRTFERHRETVATSFPYASANHLPVRFCSTRTIFNLLISFTGKLLILPVNILIFV
jgi:hypothetical protein